MLSGGWKNLGATTGLRALNGGNLGPNRFLKEIFWARLEVHRVGLEKHGLPDAATGAIHVTFFEVFGS